MSAVVVTKVLQELVQCRTRMLVENLWMGCAATVSTAHSRYEAVGKRREDDEEGACEERSMREDKAQ